MCFVFRSGSRTLKEARDYCQVCNSASCWLLQRISENVMFSYGTDVQFGAVAFRSFHRVFENNALEISNPDISYYQLRCYPKFTPEPFLVVVSSDFFILLVFKVLRWTCGIAFYTR